MAAYSEAPMQQMGYPQAASCKMTGTVKKWFEEKGFGFITSPDGTDYFVHHSVLHAEGSRKSLDIGETVEFNVITGDDGRQKADNVTGPGGAPVKGSQGGGYGGGYGRGGGYVGYGRGGGVCFKFQQGNCTFGDRCRFKHEGGSSGVGSFGGGGGGGYSGNGGYGGGASYGGRGGGSGVCFNFQKGSCSYGENCRFKHE